MTQDTNTVLGTITGVTIEVVEFTTAKNTREIYLRLAQDQYFSNDKKFCLVRPGQTGLKKAVLVDFRE